MLAKWWWFNSCNKLQHNTAYNAQIHFLSMTLAIWNIPVDNIWHQRFCQNNHTYRLRQRHICIDIFLKLVFIIYVTLSVKNLNFKLHYFISFCTFYTLIFDQNKQHYIQRDIGVLFLWTTLKNEKEICVKLILKQKFKSCKK